MRTIETYTWSIPFILLRPLAIEVIAELWSGWTTRTQKLCMAKLCFWDLDKTTSGNPHVFFQQAKKLELCWLSYVHPTVVCGGHHRLGYLQDKSTNLGIESKLMNSMFSKTGEKEKFIHFIAAELFKISLDMFRSPFSGLLKSWDCRPLWTFWPKETSAMLSQQTWWLRPDRSGALDDLGWIPPGWKLRIQFGWLKNKQLL